jgi:hypothetical protein
MPSLDPPRAPGGARRSDRVTVSGDEDRRAAVDAAATGLLEAVGVGVGEALDAPAERLWRGAPDPRQRETC